MLALKTCVWPVVALATTAAESERARCDGAFWLRWLFWP